MSTAARLLWDCAGRPGRGGYPASDYTVYDGPCWWCGLHCGPHPGRRVKTLPSTFPPQPPPAAPSSPVICAACSWTLCDKAALPRQVGEAQIRSRASTGGRCWVTTPDGEVGRYLIAETTLGTVALWSSPGNVASEQPWHDALDDLRANPRDVGDIRLVGLHHYGEIDAAPASKWRNYIHFGAQGGPWHAWTKADKAEIRAWLLDPPAARWVGVIGDGQKHGGIYSVVSPGYPSTARQPTLFGGDDRQDLVQSVFFEVGVLDYRPPDLARWLHAVESLICAGARDEEIVSGTYRPRGLDLLLATREHDPTVSEIRGGPHLALVLWLRRTRKELDNG